MTERQAPSEPIARHGRLSPSRAWKGLLAVVAITAAVTLVAAGSVAAITVWGVQHSLAGGSIEINETDAPVPTIGAYEGGFNLLIVGTDGDEGRTAILNDVNILLHVSADQTNAVAVSIPRDLVIPIPSCTDLKTGKTSSAMSAQPINVAYSYGGIPCVVATVEKLSGLDIQFAGEISFNGVIAMSNAVGGVDVCFATDYSDYKGALSFTAGTHTLQGPEAMLFLRSRHGVGDGSDITRISSQQVFLSSLVRKIKSEGTLTDVGKLFGLATAARDNMKLSKELANLDTMVAMAKALSTVSLDRLVFIQYPSVFAGEKVAPVPAKATQLFDAIAADTPIALTAAGDGEGSVLDPNATAPPVDTASPTAPATDDPATPGVTLDGFRGQTGQDQTCTVGFLQF